ncbi:MAG: cytochrome b/b6 domain-containing protein [Kordiimonadaceae bacterium]|nr:cytochrome b/b6 domain-containing protein [Kordiimonadaceae bacterium]
MPETNLIPETNLMPEAKPSLKKTRVWGLPERLFHWLLVIAFCLSSYSAFQDKFGDFATIHTWSGFSLLVLVSWRILWGFLGSDTARFSFFVKSPKATIAYTKTALTREAQPPIGHNPLGAYSVLLMLVLLLIQAALGLYATDDMFFEGPLAIYAGDLAKDITDIHELLGLILIGLICLHVTVILLYRIVKKVNLVLPMIRGYSISEHAEGQEEVNTPKPVFRSTLWAIVLLCGVGATLYNLIF